MTKASILERHYAQDETALMKTGMTEWISVVI